MSLILSNDSRKEKMSLSLVLPANTTIEWKPINLTIDYKSIFRTGSAKMITEGLTLLSVTVGLFSLFLGLSVL